MMNWINKKRNKKGFTLVELVVVIAILGILAGIAVPRFSGVQNNAKIDSDRATAKTIISAAQIFAAENNATAATDFVVSPSTTALDTLVAKGYLDPPGKAQTNKSDFALSVTGDSTTGFTYTVTGIATQTPGAGYAVVKATPFLKSNETADTAD